MSMMLNQSGLFSSGGPKGFGLQFNGTNQYAISSSGTIAYGNSFTIEFEFEKVTANCYVLGQSTLEQTVLVISPTALQLYTLELGLASFAFAFANNTRYKIKIVRQLSNVTNLWVDDNLIAGSPSLSGKLLFNQLFRYGSSSVYGGKIWNLKTGSNTTGETVDRVWENLTGTGNTWFDVGTNIVKRNFTTVSSPIWIPN